MSSRCDITALIAAARRGEVNAEANLISTVYDEFHGMAAGFMRRERPDHTLQPTALLNETWLRLMHEQGAAPKDRVHFFSKAATIMRHVLVDYAIARKAAKRGGVRNRVEMEDFHASSTPSLDGWLIFDQALTRLSAMDQRQARLVELVYFGGLTIDEASEQIGVSERTAKRDWKAAKAWLKVELKKACKNTPQSDMENDAPLADEVFSRDPGPLQ